MGKWRWAAAAAAVAVATAVFKAPPKSRVEPSVPPPAGARPEHLVVLVHGLHGSPNSLRVLGEHLAELPAGRDGSLMVHLASSNFDGYLRLLLTTADGVPAGGKRLADEVLDLKARHPSLRKLSFVGLSLGGLYAREALSHLGTGTFQLVNFMTIASPHTGVRGHLNSVFQFALEVGAVGSTGRELLLIDGNDTLLGMVSPRHLEPLQAFSKRLLCANVKYDDKVPRHAATLLPPGLPLSSMQRVPVHDREHIAEMLLQDGPLSLGDSDAGAAVTGDTPPELAIALALRGVGSWTTVLVDFGDDWLAPVLNHNRIGANTPFGGMGASVMKYLSEHFEV